MSKNKHNIFKNKWRWQKLNQFPPFQKVKGFPKKDIVPNGKYKCIHYGELFTKYGEKIDGFNLYYGCLKGSPYKWVNLLELSKFLLPKHEILKIKYFTAKVSHQLTIWIVINDNTLISVPFKLWIVVKSIMGFIHHISKELLLPIHLLGKNL